MSIRYRKNSEWTTVFVNVATDELYKLGEIVEDKVREKTPIKPGSKKWQALDIVDTVIVGSSYHQKQEKTILELLVYVVDITGKMV